MGNLDRIRNWLLHTFGTLILGHDLYTWDDFGKVFDALTNMSTSSWCLILNMHSFSLKKKVPNNEPNELSNGTSTKFSVRLLNLSPFEPKFSTSISYHNPNVLWLGEKVLDGCKFIKYLRM